MGLPGVAPLTLAPCAPTFTVYCAQLSKSWDSATATTASSGITGEHAAIGSSSSQLRQDNRRSAWFDRVRVAWFMDTDCTNFYPRLPPEIANRELLDAIRELLDAFGNS